MVEMGDDWFYRYRRVGDGGVKNEKEKEKLEESDRFCIGSCRFMDPASYVFFTD